MEQEEAEGASERGSVESGERGVGASERGSVEGEEEPTETTRCQQPHL
jgi:hypothetical protein